jgi:molecular chaperone DnaJ
MSQRDWVDKDYYKVLGVSHDATKDDIKRAYRKLAQKHHPDANKGDARAESRFKEISEAYAILSNEEKRRQYDQMRSFVQAGGERIYGFGPDQGGGVRVNVGDIGDLFGSGQGVGSMFDDLLGGFGFRDRAERAGRDVETEVKLSFDDAITGTTVTLPQGGRARIPAGVGDGARIKVAGRGEPSPGSGPAGDLYVRVTVEEHSLFTRGKNGDLFVTVPVSFPEAALGAKVEVPTLDGSVTVKVPAGSRNGKTLRVKGRGAPRPRGGSGDLLVKVEVEVPQKLSRDEKRLLEEFQESHKASPRAHLESYLQREAARRVS